ncbi:helix-turn-helix domain-containing protein [Amycolatopsis sp. NBC_01480]|uniref:helix-turn-helix domain-containing protein n=1 Tax=Amycolatopsis sp. NBC_01480 TaxID=2903562 RepID=UPI003FA40F46
MDIAEECGLSLSWAGRVLRRAGTQLPEVPRGGKRVDLHADRIAHEYRAGASIHGLTDEDYTAYGTVRQALQQVGVPLRAHGSQNRKPTKPPGNHAVTAAGPRGRGNQRRYYAEDEWGINPLHLFADWLARTPGFARPAPPQPQGRVRFTEVPPEQWTGLQAAFAAPVRDCS